MQRHKAVALVFALALVGSLAHSAGERRHDRPFKEGISVATSRLALESGSDQASFNFARLRDLWVRVTVAGAPNPVPLTLRLIDPQGALIYEASVVYASDPSIAGSPIATMEVSGAGRSVALFRAGTLRDGVALDYALPVSGSVVARSLSAGTWRLVAEAGGREFSTSIEVIAGY